MKKQILKVISLSNLFLLLCSCTSGKHYEVNDYLAGSLEIQERFTVCQLNDIHVEVGSDLNKQFEYIKKVINSRNLVGENETFDLPDLLVLNGDTFMNANKGVVTRWLDMMDTLKIPYCFNYGNHDYQGRYPNNFIDDELIKRRFNNEDHFALYPKVKDDDVFGRSNYFVNITDSGNTIFQVYLLDSNTYRGFKYDNIHEDQIRWYERCVRESNGLGENDPIKTNMIKSLMFFHVPNIDFNYAIEQYTGGSKEYLYKDHQNELDLDYLNKQEDICNNEKDDELFEKIEELRSTVSIGVAHDHINNCDIHYTGKGDWPVHMVYGLKSTDGIYHDEDAMGAVFYELKDTPYTRTSKDGSKSYQEYFDLKMINVTYDGEGSYIWKTSDPTH